MVRINAFAVEHWMDLYETSAKHNLAETCCASISLNDLLVLSPKKDLVDYTQKQVYGAIRGSEVLRNNIANLYQQSESTQASPISADRVLVTNGAIQANFLALYTHIGPEDHVICQYPTYQQLYSVPESLGADVSLWRSDEGNGWGMDLAELRSLIRPNTRMIILNNPQNPTGAILRREELQGIVDIAREHSILIHSDEVYRPLFHSLDSDQEVPPSILEFEYGNVIATGSMSKAFSLAGIRLGWIASPNSEIIEACASVRDYTIISVGQIDDSVAAHALSSTCVKNLLQRNLRLARQNLDVLEAFIEEHSWAIKWTKPKAGTTAFIKFGDREGRAIDDVVFCQRLQKMTGVMLVPGSQCFGDGVDFRGYVRLGYVPEHQVIVDGLETLRRFMRDEYEKLPLAC
ncbi:Pyridoxal phosphate-dependent transferase major region subdomain 2 [Penicillium cf. griseofulvum]|uniref:Pyridoxal phosphate-dependent transferase major region subdomain 2 n=1 Tax=Penicillium cf. griseofulvum TaxID=2972120 RepID=A0A9W9MQA1_9EURO|nr:Pyridoxal phosphate-dependent transferase major region subdomain 2 [Penicillium cf. griseofulvum]KAJ5441472.1 Pyridoxal phosphate-dependent transferase major region subdomain 2 [Penicillium cf. griseofulvum]